MTTTDGKAAQPVRQLTTHRKLVSRTEQRKIDNRLTLDAIIVPASRQARNLDSAITLARAARCALIILCSHQAAPDEVQRLLEDRSFDRAVVIGLPDNYDHRLLEFRALGSIKNKLPAACSYYTTNLSTKRNLGLLLALMVGWERIFFLDDDIRDIGHPDLQSTVSMLARYRTAGMPVTRFPDNSAACHAHRATRGAQDVFLSGSALAVNMQQNVGFFPNIYNEDWLFFYDDAARGRLGSSARKITQLVYDPFADPQRAAWQEFGDVLAEGLYALLDRGLGLEQATQEYWSDFLRARETFLRAIRRRADTAKWEIRDQLLLSVKAALECSVTIEPRVLERYIRGWRRDLEDWRQRVDSIRQMYTLRLALKELRLEPSVYGQAVDSGRPRPEVVSAGPPTVPSEPTVPYELSDLYELLDRAEIKDGSAAPDLPACGAGGLSLHRGSLGVRPGARAAATWRGFRKPRRAYGQHDTGPASEAAG
jgi:hypothetical protein